MGTTSAPFKMVLLAEYDKAVGQNIRRALENRRCRVTWVCDIDLGAEGAAGDLADGGIENINFEEFQLALIGKLSSPSSVAKSALLTDALVHYNVPCFSICSVVEDAVVLLEHGASSTYRKSEVVDSLDEIFASLPKPSQ